MGIDEYKLTLALQSQSPTPHSVFYFTPLYQESLFAMPITRYFDQAQKIKLRSGRYVATGISKATLPCRISKSRQLQTHAARRDHRRTQLSGPKYHVRLTGRCSNVDKGPQRLTKRREGRNSRPSRVRFKSLGSKTLGLVA